MRNYLLSGSVEKQSSFATDAADNLVGEHMQQQWQPDLNTNDIVIDIDPADNGLPHRRDGKVETVAGLGVLDRVNETRQLRANMPESVVKPALRAVAAEPVGDRNDDWVRHARLASCCKRVPVANTGNAITAPLLLSYLCAQGCDLGRFRRSRRAGAPRAGGRSEQRLGSAFGGAHRIIARLGRFVGNGLQQEPTLVTIFQPTGAAMALQRDAEMVRPDRESELARQVI